MKAYIVTEVEVPGEFNEDFVQQGNYSLLHRMQQAVADSTKSIVRIPKEISTWKQAFWVVGDNDDPENSWSRLLEEQGL